MDFLPYMIAPVASAIICSIVFRIAQKEADKTVAMDEDDFTIRQPKTSLKVYIFISIFIILIYGFVLLGMADGGELSITRALFMFACMSPFILLGPFLTILWYRWKIIVKDKQVTSTTYFGKTKTYTFDYITRVRSGAETNYKTGQRFEYLRVYHEKKKLFSLSSICPGFHVLSSKLAKEGVKFDWGKQSQ